MLRGKRSGSDWFTMTRREIASDYNFIYEKKKNKKKKLYSQDIVLKSCVIKVIVRRHISDGGVDLLEV